MPHVFAVSKQQLKNEIGAFFPTTPLLIDLEWLHLGDSTWWLDGLSGLTGIDKPTLVDRLLECLDRIFLSCEQDEEQLQEAIPDIDALMDAIELEASTNTNWSGYDVWSAQPAEEGG